MSVREEQYVGPYRLEKTLGKGQTGRCLFNKIMLLVVKKDNTINLGVNKLWNWFFNSQL